jgi:PAS domain S-box-containing protein
VRTLAGRALGPRWVELRAWPLDLPASGEAGIVGMLLDIDQRRRHEEALRAQRRSLHTMLDNLPGMIYRGQNDKHWTMEFVSEGCFELTGYTPLELVDNQSARFADLIHPEDRDFVWNYVQMRLTRRERYELSYRIIDRDGQTRWVWEQGRGIHSSRGEFLGLEGFITDVSSSRGARKRPGAACSLTMPPASWVSACSSTGCSISSGTPPSPATPSPSSIWPWTPWTASRPSTARPWRNG